MSNNSHPYSYYYLVIAFKPSTNIQDTANRFLRTVRRHGNVKAVVHELSQDVVNDRDCLIIGVETSTHDVQAMQRKVSASVMRVPNYALQRWVDMPEFNAEQRTVLKFREQPDITLNGNHLFA